MKKTYVDPELEIVLFTACDVVRCSGNIDDEMRIPGGGDAADS